MNPLIKLLAEQATTYIEPTATSGEGRIFNKEKFAELIVKECIETLRLVPYKSDREFGDEAIYQEAITEHFGVKE